MMVDLWKQIKKKDISPVYCLYGKESFLIQETKQLLIEYVLGEDESDFNLSSYDLEETPIELALEDAETIPFLGERRLIFLHNPVFLTAEKTKGKVEHQMERLEQYLRAPSPYSIIVFVAPYEKLDERKKITKELKKLAHVAEAKKLSEQELFRWVVDRAKSNGVMIDQKAAELVLTLSGTNLSLLTSEIDKLALFCSDTHLITEEVVEQLVSRSLEQNIFTLVEKIVQRRIEEALRIYYDLLILNEEPIKILSIIAGQFRLIYQVKELARRGYGQQQIATTLKVHPFRVKLAAGQANMFKDEELAVIMKQLADADYQAKTGGMNKELLVEMFILKLHSNVNKKS